VIEGLCRQLLEDDSILVQAHAALALGKLGFGAVEAGQALLHAAKTGEVGVRENAMRAIAIIQPPEAAEAFAAGLKDASTDVRVLASAGWMNAETVPDEAGATLLDALRDPEVRVRANAALVMSRLDTIPLAAVPLLIDCTSDPNDALRRNAATALKQAPPEVVADIMEHLTADPNVHVRLTAASSLLAGETSNTTAGTVLAEALVDPTSAVREKALDVLEALGLAHEGQDLL
jgi:HEAT repeat protein